MKKIRSIILAMLVVVVCLSGCEKIVKETNDPVIATVTDKYHRSGYFTRAGKVMVWNSPKNKVTLTAPGVETTINNKKLYDSVEIGYKIEVNWYRGYNEEGEVVISYLKLIEEQE